MCDIPEHEHGHHHYGHHHDHGPGHEHHHAPVDGFRVVVTGKGGVGKTSLTAMLARLLARESYRVLALDADPQMNLSYALGFPREVSRALVPLSQDAGYVEEKTGARPGSGWGLFFRLNPDVGDVVDRFGVAGPDGVHLLAMGTIVQPATGCLCPETSLLASVAGAVGLREGEAILLDTQAGVEHFGRALARGFRHAVVVTDPTFNAVQVALHAARLARELGIPAVHLAVNRTRSGDDLDRVRRIIDEEGGFRFASEHALPYADELLASEPDVGPTLDRSGRGSPFVETVLRLRDSLVHAEQEIRSCTS